MTYNKYIRSNKISMSDMQMLTRLLNFVKDGDTMITYSDLVQIGILIVAHVGLIYEIIKDKKK